ncbi:MAG: OsmC family protein [Pseudomonadota bacterium]|uniref:OsmC family protein n=1 Tax=Acinetobacter bereziniae TaxID=106648 RepID=A0A8I1AGC5_ACIBZ|nr:OsmC family protein [Acinetobacter bereziniae]MEC8123241.1 OsmC family protein [Pseudomonadota bacterium]QQC83128.1 OsmC family protein [Acinetobacter bereziniae]UUN96286.1 OsmC family protein [Acinetobacter bereziniae]
MQTSVHWLENVAFQANSESGHQIIMDGSAEYGGENRGPRPMELILMGLGGCASFDIVTILKKSRQNVTDVVCQLKAERADTIPAVFTKIHLHFVVTGHDVKDKQVAKAVELSAEKYCSASRMLSDGGVEITHDYEIIAAE